MTRKPDLTPDAVRRLYFGLIPFPADACVSCGYVPAPPIERKGQLCLACALEDAVFAARVRGIVWEGSL